MKRICVLAGAGMLIWTCFANPQEPRKFGKKPDRGGREAANAMFDRFDKNRDGQLTGNEIPERMRERMANIDANGDDAIDKSEFKAIADRLQGASKKSAGKTKPDGKPASGNEAGKRPVGKPGKSGKFAKKGGDGMDADAMFARLDRDGNGKLSKSELRGPLAETADRVDANGDGEISKDEMRDAMTFMRRMRDGAGKSGGGSGGRGEGEANRSPRALFNQQDVDADGRVTKNEATGKFASDFDRLDANKDGKLSLQEVESGFKSAAGKPATAKAKKN